MAKDDWVRPTYRVDKPWGHEETFAPSDEPYGGKVLFIRAGHAFSLHFHEHKDETVSVHRGVVSLEIGDSPETLERFELHPGESVRITPLTVHRMRATVDSWVVEASTVEGEDVFRLADDYGRAGLPERPRRRCP